MNSINAGTPLYTLPKGVLGYIRSLMTERLGRTAALACKALAIADETFLDTNSKRIADFVYNPQTEHSNLYALIRPLVDKLYASIGQPPLQNRKHYLAFYDSVQKAAASLDYSSPARVLTCADIRLISAPIEETFEDKALLEIWRVVSRQLELEPEEVGLGNEVEGDDDELIDIMTQVNLEKIRAWMSENKDLLGTIEELDLSEHNLRCLPKEIEFFTGLQDLNLNGNQLVTIPSTLGNLRHLRILRAACNCLSQLPLAIGDLAKLEYLELDHNRLTSVPLELGRLCRLKTLSLKNNYLLALPHTIGGLESLEWLDLGNSPWSERDDLLEPDTQRKNHIAQLPAQIGALKRLRGLHLDGNALRTLPESMRGLKRLEVLNLSSNQLEELPEGLGELGKLHVLRLTDNKLRALPKNVGMYQALNELYLAGNQLAALSFETESFPNLEVLNLSGNPLSLLTVESGALPNLRSLDLFGVSLSKFPPGIQYLTNLISLNLASNRLMDLPPEIRCLENLRNLNLHSNQIAVLPPEITRLKGLRSLDLSLNPLVMSLEPRTLPDSLTELHLDEKQFHLLRPEIGQREKLAVFRFLSHGVVQSGVNPYDPDKALEAIWGPICDAAQEAGLTIDMPRRVQYGVQIS
ncbi:MAG TPA: leucine-rich repeat domain-containing protein, partial [Rhabdochlamydiaceae bacterium]